MRRKGSTSSTNDDSMRQGVNQINWIGFHSRRQKHLVEDSREKPPHRQQ